MSGLKWRLLMISIACNIVLLARLSNDASATGPKGNAIETPRPTYESPSSSTQGEPPPEAPKLDSPTPTLLISEPLGEVENLDELARQMVTDGVPRDWLRWGIEPEVNRRAYRKVVEDYATHYAPSWVRAKPEMRPGASIAKALGEREAVLKAIADPPGSAGY